MSPPEFHSLRQALTKAGSLESRWLRGGSEDIRFNAMLTSTSLGGRAPDLIGRSVLIATADQLSAGLALIELDGRAKRLTLLPPGIDPTHLPAIVRDAGVDAIVSSGQAIFEGLGIPLIVKLNALPIPCDPAGSVERQTEWLMLTSGTTGDPKIAVHTLKGLAGAIKPSQDQPVWATFYDIRRYGGLQIFLRAILGESSLVLSQPGEAVANHLNRLGTAGVTHISGTPTHWRRALLSNAFSAINPRYIRLSGEIADQAVLDALKSAFPNAAIGHAYASTEAGVGFEVTDGLEGFPEGYLGCGLPGVEMKIDRGSLRIRSRRMASHYAGRPDLTLADADGFVDTGDMVEVRHRRCFFAGRRDGVINVGGLKVHPEEIETVINRHGMVRQSLVKARKSPIIGSIVVADVVLAEELAAPDYDRIKAEIMGLCREFLAPYKIPAMINAVSKIESTAGGKLPRHHA